MNDVTIDICLNPYAYAVPVFLIIVLTVVAFQIRELLKEIAKSLEKKP